MLSNINLPKETVLREMRQIFNPVKFGESGTVMCYPACKFAFNFIRFLTYKNELKLILGKHYQRFAFIQIHLDDQENATSFLDKVKNEAKRYKIKIKKDDTLRIICEKIIDAGKDPYFLLFSAQLPTLQVLQQIIQDVHQVILELNRVGALLFIETNIYDTNLLSILSKNYKFMRSIITIPTYSHEESKFFLNSLSNEWKIKLYPNTISQILKKCTGVLWILRETVRIIRETGITNINQIFTKPGIRLRVNAFIEMLTLDEKGNLAQLCFGNLNKVNKKYITYFLEIGLIKKNGANYILTILLIEDLLKEYLNTKKVEVINDQVYYQEFNITNNLSLIENKILKALIEKAGSLISREDIAKIIWEKDWYDKYSEWAIDKTISRLRLTLVKIGLSKKFLLTKKGQGFLITT